MFPLLLLTTLLLPLTQGEPCLSRQDVLDIVKELEFKLDKKDAEMALMETRLDKKDAEMEAMKAKLEKKVESVDLSVAVAEAVRDLPYTLVSVSKYAWSTPNATITYDSYLADSSSGGAGSLDLATGTFTCLFPGHYTISYSGHSELLLGKVPGFPDVRINFIYLHVNGVRLEQSLYDDYMLTGSDGDSLTSQGSRSLVGPLAPPTPPDPPPRPGRHPRAQD